MNHPVGQKRPNAWGLYDMHGSLFQRCSDFYGEDYYQRSPMNDPAGPSSATPFPNHFVVRGGSHRSTPLFCRSAYRYPTSTSPYPEIGFRVVCEIAGEATEGGKLKAESGAAKAQSLAP